MVSAAGGRRRALHHHARAAIVLLTVSATSVLAATSGAWAAQAPTTTVSPTGIKRITRAVDEARELGLSVVIALLTAVALFVLPYVLWRLFRTRRVVQLVVDDLKDGTGDPGVKDRLAGLSQEFREQVAAELGALAKRARDTLSLARLEGVRLSQQPLAPRTAPEATAQALADSLSSLAEKSKPVTEFLTKFLLRPRGTRVAVTLQRRGVSPDRVGISVGIADLRDEGLPEGKTIWEELRRSPQLGSGGQEPKPPRAPDTDPVQNDAGALRSAAELRNVARNLERIGLLQDSLTHLAAAFQTARSVKAEHELAAIAAATSRVGAKLGVQSRGKASYGLGQKLEQAGRIDEAIAAYIGGLPVELQEEAHVLWADALSSVAGVAARSLMTLAHVYSSHAYAWEEGRELLKRAEKLGLAEALAERKRVTSVEAAALARAARSLLELARYDAAKTVAERCLTVDPDNREAQAVQAGVIKALAPQDGQARATAAQLALAGTYLKTRKLDDAQKAFVTALSTSPDLAEARSGLEQVLRSTKSLDTRLGELLRPAAALLALQLLRRELVAKQLAAWWRRVPPITALNAGVGQAREAYAKRNEGLVRNYVGMLLQGNKGHSSVGLEFLRHAIEELKQAAALIPDFYQPYENLGDSYIFTAKALEARRNREDETVAQAIRRNIELGIEQYDKGLEVLKKSTGTATEAKTGIEQYQKGLQLTPSEAKTAKRLLQTALAIAFMLEGGPQDLGRARNFLGKAIAGWTPAEERHARLLLNVAAAYGRLLKAEMSPNPEWLSRGRGLLAYGLGRDGSRIYWVIEKDPDYEPLLKGVDLKTLKAELLAADPDLYRLDGDTFAREMQLALARAKWPDISNTLAMMGGSP